MTAISDRLTTALSDRYRLERELGQACPERQRGGGMATVNLAELHRGNWPRSTP